MDACLMAMIEVQYQVRKFADVMVASQEVEPMHGWPYTEILEKLNLRPTMDAAELGTLDRRPIRQVVCQHDPHAAECHPVGHRSQQDGRRGDC